MGRNDFSCRSDVCTINARFGRIVVQSWLIWEHFEGYRNNVEKFLLHDPLKISCDIVDKQFGSLFSRERSELIKRCLTLRRGKLLAAIPSYEEEEELSRAD